ncbi:TRAP transporter small permease subunit [Undibacter mobilis]|uniref:TRAP transporter small permease protein n=1 Tax=Undibacter mobilis TaxID=2292256 RepID=A0A371BA25_9BRAD|nr:TRAP transporter small permease [Undibacter mobilis]RDV04404.1 TRAP transporter small permease [Undibacter mobilis]
MPRRLSPHHAGSWQPVAIADRLSRFTMVVAAALTFAVAIVLLADVVSRAVAGRPMGGVKDIVGNVIVMIVFLQAGYAVRCRSMQRTDFLLGLMPWPARRIALAVGYALGAMLFAAIAAANWPPALAAFGGSAGVAAWIARFAIVAGAALACVNYGLLAILDLTGAEPTLDSELADLRRLEP